MSLSREDCITIANQVEMMLQEYDQFAYEVISELMNRNADPSRYLYSLIRNIRNYYNERSINSYPTTLQRLRYNVTSQDGGQIQGISIALSPRESERYRIDEISFDDLHRYSPRIRNNEQLVQELGEMLAQIERELYPREGGQ